MDCAPEPPENLKHRIKCVVLFFLIIVLFISFGYFAGYSKGKLKSVDYNPENQTGLLSQRVYAGIVKEKSRIAFNLKPLQEVLVKQITDNNLNVSFYINNMRNGVDIGFKEDSQDNPVSLNKIPIAIIILRKVELGQLSLDEKVVLQRTDNNSQSGILYKQIGSSFTIKELLHQMLANSDNTATLALMDRLSFEDIQFISDYFNYYNSHPFQESPSERNNLFLVSPASVYPIFESVFLSSLLNIEHSELILSELTNTSFDIKGYARLPDDVTVSQKYGEYYENGRELFHSCGIIYYKDSRFFYCIMTNGMDLEPAQQEVGGIVNTIYQFMDQIEQRG